MPRIKFSTLVSAMSGKSNGSVFASNRGGAFFRNNKSGSKLSTQKQQIGQAKFRSVARQWAELDDDQRASWNAAVNSFPTTNIFGDQRTPSGYELFCRINGGLVLRDIPMLQYPPIPRPIPEIISMGWATPPEFLFQNQYVLSSFNALGQTSPVNVESVNTTSPATAYSLRTSCLRVSVPQDVSDGTYNDTFFSAEQSTEDGTEYRVISLRKTSVLGFHLEVEVNHSMGTFKGYHQIDLQQLKDGLDMIIVWSNTAFFNVQVFVNGAFVSLTGVTHTGSNLNFALESMKFALDKMSTGAKVTLERFQFYNKALNASQQALVNMNYVYPEVYMTAQVVQLAGVAMVTYGYCDYYTDFYYDGPVGPDQVFNPVSLTVKPPLPLIELNLEGQAINGFVAEVLTTRPVSSGVGLKSADKALQKSEPYAPSMRISLTDALRTSFGYFTEGSDFNISLRLFDSQTGITYAGIDVPKPPRKPRFKAGSDLSNKVNLPVKP